MQSLIASFLIQHKTCSLPGLGTLSIQHKPAEADFTGKQIIAPAELVVFSSSEQDQRQLISFIARKQHCSYEEAENKLLEFCRAAINKPSITIPAIGSFKKNENDSLDFEADGSYGAFTLPVPALRVIHPEAGHSILVGDKETTSTAMTEYYMEEPPKKSRWWIWMAIILGSAGLAIAAVYFSQKGFSVSSTGNRIHI